MTDDELIKYLNLTLEEAAIVLPQMTPQRRSLYNRMAEVEAEVALWSHGLGPKPTGVLIDVDRHRKDG